MEDSFENRLERLNSKKKKKKKKNDMIPPPDISGIRFKKKKKLKKKKVSLIRKKKSNKPSTFSIGEELEINKSFSVKPKKQLDSFDPRFDTNRKLSLNEKLNSRKKYWFAYEKQEERSKELRKIMKDSVSETHRKKIQKQDTRITQILKKKKDDEIRKQIIEEHNTEEVEKIKKGKKPWLMTERRVNTLLRKRKFEEDSGKYVKKKRRKIMQKTNKVTKELSRKRN